MDGRQLQIGKKDVLRVESKIHTALQHRVVAREGDGAKNRIKGLHAFLEEIEGKDSISKSKDLAASRDSTSTTNKELKEAQHSALLREQEYLGGLAQAKSTIKMLNVELSAAKSDLDVARRLLVAWSPLP